MPDIVTNFMMKLSYKIYDKSLHRISIFSSVLLSLVMVMGRSIYNTNDISNVFASPVILGKNMVVLAGSIILFYFLIKIILNYLKKNDISSPVKNNWRFFGRSKGSLFFVWAVIFVCWIPCFLAYYPGIFSYDIPAQTEQALGIESFDRFEIVAHTFLFKICIKLGGLFGGPEAGLVTYTIIQMMIMSFVFAFTVWYMARVNIHYGFRITALIYFAVNPMNAIFSIVPTKNVLFTGLFVLTTIIVIEIVRNPAGFFNSYLRQIGVCAVLVLFCLFLNNAIFILILFFPCLMFAYKKYMLKISRLFLVFLICFLLINGPVFTALGVKEGKNTREMMSVPSQQIATVVVNHEEELSIEEGEAIREILNYHNIKYSFNPRLADPVKNGFKSEVFWENPEKYISLWISLFQKYPVDYINAFLTLNIPYWYPASVHPDSYSLRFYIETYISHMDEFSIERQSKIPWLLEFYEAFASGRVMQKIPLISLLFSISIPIWFVFFSIMILIAKKRKKLILMLLPALFLWATYLLGPVSNLRYIYPVIACYPIYLAFTFSKGYKLPPKSSLNL